MIIENYGLFWKRNRVHWGWPGNRGHLKGRIGPTGTLVDFRKQKGIYALYGDGLNLVYVGQAGGGNNDTLFTRLRRHKNDHISLMWSHFSWFGILPVINDEIKTHGGRWKKKSELSNIINHIEAILIAVAEPPRNLQGGRFGRAKQYDQYIDEDHVYPDIEEMIRYMYDRSE